MEFIAGLHPKFVHFPIALFLLYTLFEIAGIIIKKEFLNKAAFIILLLSIMGAVAAVLTGNQASAVAEKLSDLDVNIPLGAVSKHEDYANYAMWYMFLLAALRTYLLETTFPALIPRPRAAHFLGARAGPVYSPTAVQPSPTPTTKSR